MGSLEIFKKPKQINMKSHNITFTLVALLSAVGLVFQILFTEGSWSILGPDPLTNIHFISGRLERVRDTIASDSEINHNEKSSNAGSELDEIRRDLNSVSSKVRARRNAPHPRIIFVLIFGAALAGIFRTKRFY